MKNNLALPAQVEKKLSALARHIYWLRGLRGLCLVTALLAVCFGSLFVFDLWQPLTEEILAPVLGAILAATGFVIFFALLIPLWRRIDHAGLAALIEKKHPELAERLTSSVKISEGDDPHGTETFLRRLLQETNEQTQSLVFERAISSRSSRVLMMVAAVALLAVVVPAALWPAHAADFSKRFLLSWFAPPALRLQAVNTAQFVGSGRAWSVSMQIQRRDERVAWPQSAWLVLTDAEGHEKKLPMQAEAADRFSAGLESVQATYFYHFEAGGARSEEYQLVPIEPVELAANSPQITVTPPPYVNSKIHARETLPPGTANIFALEYAEVQLDFRISRCAEKAMVKITPANYPDEKSSKSKTSTATSWTFPVAFSENRQRGLLVLPMLAPGTYRLTIHMEAEHGIATDRALPELHVWKDRPPFFVEPPAISGVPQKASPTEGEETDPVRIAPHDSIHVLVKAGDTVGLGPIAAEYRIGNGKTETVLLAEGKGRHLVEVDRQFTLRGVMKDGDNVYFRLKAVDNRRLARGLFRDVHNDSVPAKRLQPQLIYYPAPENGKEQWLTFKVDSGAKSLEEREIVAQRDSVQKLLDTIKEKIIRAREKLNHIEQPSRHLPILTDAQMDDLKRLGRHNDTIEADLKKLAKETANIPELREIGEKTQAIANGEITRAGQALKNASRKEDDRVLRQQEMFGADKEWARALKRLRDLHKLNAKRFQDRLDAMKIQQLAQKEQELSDEAAKLNDQKPTGDPKWKKELEKLRAGQSKLTEELNKMAQNNPHALHAMKMVQAEQASRIAKQASDMALEQRKLAQQADHAWQKQLQKWLDEYAKKQQKIASGARQLQDRTSKEAEAGKIEPLQAKLAGNAAQSLKQGRLQQALRQQKQTAGELDRFARNLEEALEFNGSPRQLAQELAKKQQQLEERLLQEAAMVARKPLDQLFKAVKKIHKDQEALRQAAQKGIKANYAEPVKAARRRAIDHLQQAAAHLRKFNALQAKAEMTKAKRSLDQLAALLPASAPKQKLSADEMAVRRKIDQLRDLARKQRKLRQQLQEMLTGKSTPDDQMKNDALAKFSAQEKKMEEQAAKMMQKLLHLSQAKTDSMHAKKSALAAAKSGQDAQKAMQKARQQGEKGNSAGAKESAQQAAKMLARAAAQAEETAMALKVMKAGTPPNSQKMQQAGKALKQGQQQMAKAQNMLRQSRLSPAQQAMQKAAQALQKASQDMAQQMQSKSSAGKGGKQPAVAPRLPAPLTMADLNKPGTQRKKYSGKKWGELPGELQTRILMDMRAQYGAEYARVIQRYFERLADTESAGNELKEKK